MSPPASAAACVEDGARALQPASGPPVQALLPRLAGRRRIPAVLWDAVAASRACTEEAHARAAAITDEARREAATIRARAAAEGRDEGLASVSAIHAAAVSERDRLLGEAQAELVELAFGIAERVIGELVRSHPALVLEAAVRALDESRARHELTLRASAADLAALQAAEPLLATHARGTPRIRFVPDASVARGDVVVESDLGRVEASVGAQLRALRRAIRLSRPELPSAPEPVGAAIKVRR